jgi:hypothetical protein
MYERCISLLNLLPAVTPEKYLRTKFSCLVDSLLSRHGVAFNFSDMTAPYDQGRDVSK